MFYYSPVINELTLRHSALECTEASLTGGDINHNTRCTANRQKIWYTRKESDDKNIN